MSMTRTEPDGIRHFPLDVTGLVKGQTLTVEYLRTIPGMAEIEPQSPQWGLRLLTLRVKIERLRAQLGLPVLTMRIHKGTLIVCDDSGASIYNRSMGKRGIRRFTRASVRNLCVDMSKLTTEEAQAHQRTLMRQAMMLVAIREARHRGLPKPAETERTTPRMVAGPAGTQ